jgi:hypothetical protein
MCEIALVVVDTVNEDFYRDCMCYKAGDVIEVLPDGWKWGTLDMKNPNWRILKFPGIDVSQFTQFTSPQLPVDINNPSRTLLRRALQFDHKMFAKNRDRFAKHLADDKRVDPFFTVTNFSVKDLAKFTMVKKTVADPNPIGVTPANTIG